MSKKIATIALAVLIYHTVSSEIDGMLSPPADMEHVWKAIDKLTGAAKNEVARKPTLLTGGMSYLYEHDGNWVKKFSRCADRGSDTAGANDNFQPLVCRTWAGLEIQNVERRCITGIM